MRALLGLLFALLASPVPAADWGHYANARFGYAIDVPPGFAGQGESDNGDGQLFGTPTALLAVYGMNLTAADFEAEVRQDQDYARQDGWTITYEATTPDRASYSGVRGGRILYARMIALCGDTLAGFALEYDRVDVAKFDPVITRLVRSLRATAGSAACPAQ